MPDPTPTLTDEQREALDGAFLDWLAGDDPDDPSMGGILEALAPLIARMVAEAEQRGRAEASAAVEAACGKSEALTQDAIGHVSEHWRGVDYADGLDAGIETTTGLVRAVLADPAAAVARIKAEAWDEGAAEGIRMHNRHQAWMLVNPYRADRIGGAPDA